VLRLGCSHALALIHYHASTTCAIPYRMDALIKNLQVLQAQRDAAVNDVQQLKARVTAQSAVEGDCECTLPGSWRSQTQPKSMMGAVLWQKIQRTLQFKRGGMRMQPVVHAALPFLCHNPSTPLRPTGMRWPSNMPTRAHVRSLPPDECAVKKKVDDLQERLLRAHDHMATHDSVIKMKDAEIAHASSQIKDARAAVGASGLPE
jgi:hypothetical protein